MDQNFANQIACQLHGIHWKLRSAETPQPAIGSPSARELQVGISPSDSEYVAHDTEFRPDFWKVPVTTRQMRTSLHISGNELTRR